MPRVHGIDIIPRRGKGPCRYRVSMVADGMDNCASGMFEGNKAGASSTQLSRADEEIEMHHLDGSSMSLDKTTYHGSIGSHNGEGNDVTASPRKSNPGINISGTAHDETMPAVDTDSSTPHIRPQPRESLDSIEFGSHSFSVQQISRKPSLSCSLDNLRFDSLGQSLESIVELPPLTGTKSSAQTEQSRETMGDTANEAESNEDVEKSNRVEIARPIHPETEISHTDEGTTLTDTNTPRNQNEPEETRQRTEQSTVPIRDWCPIDASDSLNVSNTHWLFHRCCAACLQMESPLSPLELAIKTLHVIRCIANDDQFDEHLQHKLFVVLKNGKRRDLEFVFEVSERAVELRDDTTLTEESLREAASITTRNDVEKENMEANNNNSDEYEIDAHPDFARQTAGQLSTASPAQFYQQVQVQFEQNKEPSTAHSTPSGKSHSTTHISRRKKRHSNANNVILQDETSSFASTKEKIISCSENGHANKEELHTDFVTTMDGLDLKDDDMWSFLPNTQPIDMMENVEQPPTQRITRSMNIINYDEANNSGPCHEIPSPVMRAANIPENCVEGDKADDHVAEMDTRDIDLNTTVTDVRIECTDRDRVDDLRQGGRSNIQLLREDHVHGKCTGSSNGDSEVFSMVKTRERNDGKGSVRIIFTGLTPTRRHMQMIETIGAEYVHSIEEAHTATHVIASDGITKLRRTPKLMICICRVSQILSIEWLEQSSQQQCVLNTDEFLLLNDREAERRYDFSMKTTLRNGIRARKRRGGVLGGWFVYICSGVAGNKAPSLKEIYLIVEAGGGQILKSLSSRSAFDPTKTIVLTSDPSTKSQLGELGVARAKRCGAKIMSTSHLFHTIITQNLLDIDIEDDVGDDALSPPTYHFADIDMCASPVSMTSSISVKSITPVKRGGMMSHFRLATHTPLRETPMECNDNESVRTRGSRVSHLEHAMHIPSPEPKKRKLIDNGNKRATQRCSNCTTRHSLKTVLTSIEKLSADKDQAAVLTSNLWLLYFNDVSKASLPVAAKIMSNRQRKGVRCLRGRNRSISPLVSCTNPVIVNEPTIANNRDLSKSHYNQLLEENLFVTWESYILFTLRNRAQTIESGEIIPACHYFPRPIAIIQDERAKYVSECAQTTSPNPGLSLNLESGTEGPSFQIFGTLQDLFSLYRQHQTLGMIPEQAIALLALQAIEAVAAMHSCQIVHNDIGLDSFLVVKKVETFTKGWGQQGHEKSIDSWYLQLIGFGHNAVVLNCQETCQEEHFAHDYQCLANVIHLLITGGVELSLTSATGKLDFSSKPYIKGNLLLRGALSWCTLFQALLHVGELASVKQTTVPFRLHYPVDFSIVATSDDERMGQFGWSCRILQELCDRRVLNDLIDGLYKQSYRCTHPSMDVSTFGSAACNERHSFTCCTSSEQTADQLMEKESRLQSDCTALAQREASFKEDIAKFEQSKIDQQSLLRRESDVRMRENDLLQREREHALELNQLEALKEEIRATERRIEHKLQLLKAATSSTSSCRTSSHQRERSDRMLPGEPNSRLPLESQLHATQLSATKSVLEQPMRKISGHLHKNRIHFTNEDTFLSPHTSHHKPTIPQNKKSISLDPSKGAASESHDDFHQERQYSQESTSSSKQKKKGSARKSPKCSLHFLPRSPQKTPKKVFIDLGEE